MSNLHRAAGEGHRCSPATSSPENCSAFLDAMYASFDNARTPEARAARLELAAAILWAQAMHDYPDPHFIKLLGRPSAAVRRRPAAGRCSAQEMDATVAHNVVRPLRRSVAFLVRGGTPSKTSPADSERSSGKQLSKSGGRRAHSTSGDEESLWTTLKRLAARDAAPATPSHLFQQGPTKCPLPR